MCAVHFAARRRTEVVLPRLQGFPRQTLKLKYRTLRRRGTHLVTTLLSAGGNHFQVLVTVHRRLHTCFCARFFVPNQLLIARGAQKTLHHEGVRCAENKHVTQV